MFELSKSTKTIFIIIFIITCFALMCSCSIIENYLSGAKAKNETVVGAWVHVDDPYMSLTLNDDNTYSIFVWNMLTDNQITQTGTYTFDGDTVLCMNDSGNNLTDTYKLNENADILYLGDIPFYKQKSTSSDVSSNNEKSNDSQSRIENEGNKKIYYDEDGNVSQIDELIFDENTALHEGKRTYYYNGCVNIIEEGIFADYSLDEGTRTEYFADGKVAKIEEGIFA